MEAGKPIAAPLAAAPAAASPRPSAEDARKSAEDFAAFFFSQSLESMFSSSGSDTLFGGGSSEAVYRSLMLQEYGKVAARSGGLGITDAVQREILRLQEGK